MNDWNNNLKHYKIEFSRLNLRPDDILNIPGHEINDSDFMMKMIEDIFVEATEKADVKGGYFITDDFRFCDKNTISVEGHVFNTKQIINKQIKGATRIAVFACTAGPALELWSKELLYGEDPVKGYMINTLASLTVDAGMDVIQNDLEEDMKRNQLALSNRFSPGYCGWPLSDNQILFSLLPPGFCGIQLNDSSFMTPVKSVSGIIGIGKEVRQEGYPCDYCSKTDCVYRKEANKPGME